MNISSQWKSKPFQACSIIVLCFTTTLLSGLIDGAFERYGPVIAKHLRLYSRQNYPLPEISGVHVQGDSVIFIGDQLPQIGQAVLANGAINKINKVDFSKTVLRQYTVCANDEINECRKQKQLITSQWEAISTDGSGRYFLLNEQLSTIFVYNPKTDHVDSLINLSSFNPESGAGKRQSKRETNALAEGLFLLKNGHILIAKQGLPPSIVEFGPQGSTAAGFEPSMTVKNSDIFKVTAEKMVMKPLKIWSLASSFQACDLNELSGDSAGNLYILSKKCNWISQVTRLSLTDKDLQFTELWALPDEIRNAEALAVLNPTTFLVGTDRKSAQEDNVFVVKTAE